MIKLNFTIHSKNPSFKSKSNLVKRSDYRGPLLKLTKKEKEKITELNDRISQLEIDFIKVANKLNKNPKTITRENMGLTRMYQILDTEIKVLRNMIKEIKINRLNIQKEKLKNQNLLMSTNQK